MSTKSEWKVNQEVYHRINSSFDDDLKNFDIKEVDGTDIINYAVDYFTNDKAGWIYPSKSYVVAICYAKWLSKEFGEQFYSVLDDPDLLYGNDPYFLPYSESKEIYNEIIKQVGLGFDETQGIIPDIRKYFEEECLLKEYEE
jgi:hypothetical protein